MIKIEKHKFIQRFMTLFGFVLLALVTTFMYLLICDFKIHEFGNNIIYYFGVICIEAIMCFLIYLIIRMLSKKHYLINDKQIILVSKGKENIIIDFAKVKLIYYVRAIHLILLQMGAGYLHLNYLNASNEEKLYSISMSKNDAKKISMILNRSIEIR